MLFPSELSLDGYRYVIQNGKIFNNYTVSITVTVTGTFLAVIITSMFGYGLAHPKVENRFILSFLTYIPMVLGSGLVGFYLLIVKYLKINETIWAMILPYIVNPFYVFIMISFYRDLPYELIEASYIDGATDITVFFRVAWPMSVIPTVTIMLFYALTYWNDWWLSMLFINKPGLQPLQLLIRNLTSFQQLQSTIGMNNLGLAQPLTVQLVTVCITIGPILLVYPFIQKYFVKGVTLGAVKG